MGLGDEILALGRAEQIFKETGRPVSICNDIGSPRSHDAWLGNPAWSLKSSVKIIDGAGCRPYICNWRHNRITFNLDHRPNAGRIWLTEKEMDFNQIKGDYAVVAPDGKAEASPNKNWGAARWEKVIKDFPIPVYQCIQRNETPIKGAIGIRTKHFRLAASIISKAKLVMCNEGGSHHMAASFRVPAVVIFGSFIPPSVTGYPFHKNVYRETEHGFCGDWSPCKQCLDALESITPEEVRGYCMEFLK